MVNNLTRGATVTHGIMEKVVNFRNVFKSDHLSMIDVQELIENGHNGCFTIREVKQELNAKVAGKKIDANIAYFVENIKPMVLNAKNSTEVYKYTKTINVLHWKNIPVKLVPDPDRKMGGEVVGGITLLIDRSARKIDDTNALSILNSSKTLAELKANWDKLNSEEKALPSVNKLKDELKTKLA